ncbi:peptidase M23 [Marivirga lumbricoides]|nr:peptidase M23 [Marivirga lumbricoides]
MDFTAHNKKLLAIDLKDTDIFNKHVFDLLAERNKEFGWGGYLENREIYKRSTHFQQGEPRNFHLGIDVWAKAGSSVYCPMAAKVHSFADNNNFGDYGPTIILEHQIGNNVIYTLYGHLSRKSLNNLHEGQLIEKGDKFCEIGPYPENGDWPPHLHFQVMKDMLGNKGDFPGVCSASQLEKYKSICINPEVFIT